MDFRIRNQVQFRITSSSVIDLDSDLTWNLLGLRSPQPPTAKPGLYIVRDKKGPSDVAAFVDKLAKRELTMEALPASLRIAINGLGTSSSV